MPGRSRVERPGRLAIAFAPLVGALPAAEVAVRTTPPCLVDRAPRILYVHRERARCEEMWRKILLLPLVTIVAVEAAFQLLAFCGVLPGLNIASHAPYGRVYWTLEGFGNSVANRFGWYAPDFALAPGSRRIVLVGDSFVEGLQVQPEQNIGVVLQRLLEQRRDPSEPPVEVLSLGLSGHGPAQYVEIVDYAMERFAPQEVVVFVTSSNDFSDVVAGDGQPPPETYAYYVIGEDGELRVHEASGGAVETLRRALRQNGSGILANLPTTLASHYLTPKVLTAVAHATEVAAQPWFIGPRRAAFFRKERSDEVRTGFDIASRLLLRARDRALAGGATFRLVSIPHFPSQFYWASDPGWSPEMGEHDLLAPEKVVSELAAREGIPFLGLGRVLLDNGLSREEVRRLYYYDGVGHFSPAGHSYFGAAVFRAFYDEPRSAGAASVSTPPPRSGATRS
jgi:hypothetical protein